MLSRHSQALTLLESLLLEGNPVTREPNYRLYVIGLLADSLKTLDKHPITPKEKQVRSPSPGRGVASSGGWCVRVVSQERAQAE